MHPFLVKDDCVVLCLVRYADANSTLRGLLKSGVRIQESEFRSQELGVRIILDSDSSRPSLHYCLKGL
jgi:hypothetical protein